MPPNPCQVFVFPHIPSGYNIKLFQFFVKVEFSNQYQHMKCKGKRKQAQYFKSPFRRNLRCPYIIYLFQKISLIEVYTSSSNLPEIVPLFLVLTFSITFLK